MNHYQEEYIPESKRLGVIDGIEITDVRYKRSAFLVDGFLKPGLSVLAGAPKIGKSWMVLQLCLSVAKGEPFMGMNTRKSTVLYIDLEDSEQRMQDRILRSAEESSDQLKITFACSQLGEGIADEIRNFKEDYPETRLVVIDTFQKIRMPVSQSSYAIDYAEISHLKRVSDELNICILLVHHTRKMGDNDALNEISGTNGIAGSSDTLMVLKKPKRSDSKATLFCTGRDIEDRTLELLFDRENCRWRITSDSLEEEEEALPDLLVSLREYMRRIGRFDGVNTAFCRGFSDYVGYAVNPSQLKRMMNRFRFQLEDVGVCFLSYRTKSGRLLTIKYAQSHDCTAVG